MLRLSVLALVLLPSLSSGADALDQVNAQRAARGLPAYLRDGGLSLAAENAAQYRAANRLFGHCSNDFAFLPPGSTADAAGCAAHPPSYGFLACAVYDGYQFAGAATIIGRDGLAYHHLFVRGGVGRGAIIVRERTVTRYRRR